MKLRWLIKKYPQPTKEAVLALWNNGKDGLTMSKCVDMLSKKDESSLQMYIPKVDGWPNQSEWVDIPIIVEEVNGT